MDSADSAIPQGARAREPWQPQFLEQLAERGNVSNSAKAAGVHRTTAQKARQRDDEFAQAWDAAIEEALDQIEDIVMKTAREGEDITTSRWVLARRRPTVWGDRTKVELSGSVAFDRDADNEILEHLTRLAEVAQQEEDANARTTTE